MTQFIKLVCVNMQRMPVIFLTICLPCIVISDAGELFAKTRRLSYCHDQAGGWEVVAQCGVQAELTVYVTYSSLKKETNRVLVVNKGKQWGALLVVTETSLQFVLPTMVPNLLPEYICSPLMSLSEINWMTGVVANVSGHSTGVRHDSSRASLNDNYQFFLINRWVQDEMTNSLTRSLTLCCPEQSVGEVFGAEDKDGDGQFDIFSVFVMDEEFSMLDRIVRKKHIGWSR